MFLITSIDTHEITSQIVVHDAIENARETKRTSWIRKWTAKDLKNIQQKEIDKSD